MGEITILKAFVDEIITVIDKKAPLNPAQISPAIVVVKLDILQEIVGPEEIAMVIPTEEEVLVIINKEEGEEIDPNSICPSR